MMNIEKCPVCGGKVSAVAKEGRTGRHRNVRDLPIPADIKIPTCAKCGEMYIDPTTGAAMDAALKQAYDERLRWVAQRAITSILTARVAQKELESHLGLAQGYVSKLLAGAKTPSYDLAAHLALISRAPRKRMKEESGAIKTLISRAAGPVSRLRAGRKRPDKRVT